MRYLFLLLVLSCVSCGTALPTIKPYKLDVQQGNVVTSKMLLQLRPGMTKSQVRFIMGTPLIQDSFHGNRWDYVYQMREGGKLKEQRRVIMDFENEELKSVRGDVVASGSEAAKSNEPEAPTGTRVVTPLKKPENKGFFNKLKFWEKDEAAQAKEAAEKQAADKAKLEAEQAAKDAAARKSQEATAVEEQKSLLAVPIEVPVESAPVVMPKVESAPLETVAPAAIAVEPQPVEITPMEAKPAEAQTSVEQPPVNQPVEPQPYDSSSGMQFDKKMELDADKAITSTEPVVSKPSSLSPRSENKAPPVPEDISDDEDISTFDRILEKIGF
jgi:outer membrane protein assembly factor BamE